MHSNWIFLKNKSIHKFIDKRNLQIRIKMYIYVRADKKNNIRILYDRTKIENKKLREK